MTPYPQARTRRVEDSPSDAPTEICIRMWTSAQPARGDANPRWDTDDALVYMIGDMVLASEGSPRAEGSRSLVARFPSPPMALTAARRIQHAVREFVQHRPETCFGVSIRIHPPEGLRAVGDPDPRELALEQAEPGQILVAQETYAALHALPGLQFRGTQPSEGFDHELIWTTPENYQRFRELFERAREHAVPASDGTTAEMPYAATRIWAAEEITTAGEVEAETSEARPLAGDTWTELPAEESRIYPAVVRSWWAGAIAIVLVLVAVLVLVPSRGKRQSRGPTQPLATPPQHQATPPQNAGPPKLSDGAIVAPVATSEENPKTETTQPRVPEASPLESPKIATHKEERPKKETAAAVDKRGLADYDGFTAREIPQLLRRADADAGAGNYQQARREYDIVLKLEPGNATAKQGLHRLDLREHESR